MSFTLYYVLSVLLLLFGLFSMIFKNELVSLLLGLQLLFLGANLLLFLVSMSKVGPELDPMVLAVFAAWTFGLEMAFALLLVTILFRRRGISQVDELLQKTFS